MLNKEKYAKEIMDIACAGHNIALNNRTKELCSCGSITCSHCEFNRGIPACSKACETWCNSKYIPSGVRLYIDIEYNRDKINMTAIEHALIDAGYKVINSDFEAISKAEMEKLVE